MDISLGSQVTLLIAGTWIMLRVVDCFWPPHNPVMNAMLSLGSGLVCIANHLPG